MAISLTDFPVLRDPETPNPDEAPNGRPWRRLWGNAQAHGHCALHPKSLELGTGTFPDPTLTKTPPFPVNEKPEYNTHPSILGSTQLESLTKKLLNLAAP